MCIRGVKKEEMVGAFLAPLSYELQTIVTSREFKKQYLPPDHRGTLNEAEFITMAEYNWK